MSLTKYGGAALTVAAKLDMKAASNPAIRKPSSPAGTKRPSAIGSTVSKSRLVPMARRSGPKKAAASTVRPMMRK